jgi:nucleoside phosphorylase
MSSFALAINSRTLARCDSFIDLPWAAPIPQWARDGKRSLQLLIALALEMEFAPWCRGRQFVRVSSEHSLYEARVGESNVRVVVTGMGPRTAKQAASRAMQQSTDACVVCGLAGALQKGFERGEIVVAAQVREAESQRLLKSDARLLARALRNGAQPIELCTASYLVSTAEGKRRMAPLGDAVDMESFVVMEQAAERGIPAVAIRAIDDLVNENLPADLVRVVDSRGEINCWRGAMTALKAPQRLPSLIRFGWQSQRAAKGLARFLDQFVVSLPAEMFVQSDVDGTRGAHLTIV